MERSQRLLPVRGERRGSSEKKSMATSWQLPGADAAGAVGQAGRAGRAGAAGHLLAALAEFFVAAAIQSARGGSAISLTDPGVPRTVIGASLYLTVIAVIGLTLGALLRRTAVGVSVFAGVFFVAPVIVAQLSHSVARIAPYLPSSAGGALWGQPLAAHPLGPWTGFAVLCGYAVVLTGLAAWRLRRRDA
jgi:ABC-type transport system involved in multi-copper enzyme maturation permease subunit